jgi:hypothetical protein
MNNEERFGVGCLAILFMIIGGSVFFGGIHGCSRGTQVTIPNRLHSTKSPYKMHFGFALIGGGFFAGVGIYALYQLFKGNDK